MFVWVEEGRLCGRHSKFGHVGQPHKLANDSTAHEAFLVNES
jgi:hypothetical protein